MPIHPAVAARFHHLDGLGSLREVFSTQHGRECWRRFESWESSTPPPDVGTRDASAPGPHGPVPVRIYEPSSGRDGPRTCLVWLHGGGFAGGDLDMREADWTAREVCSRAGSVVVSVDYRLATGAVCYPVPLDDAVAAISWVRESAAALGIDPARISVGGASAGANLSAGAVMRLRDGDGWLPAHLVFVYGLAHPVTPPPSPGLLAALAELPLLLRPKPDDDATWVVVNYLGGPLSAADGYAMPALGVLDGLCPTLVLNGEYDPLRSSGEAFTAALALAGVDVRQVLLRGTLHGFLSLPAEVEPVSECLDLIADVLRGSMRSSPPEPRRVKG